MRYNSIRSAAAAVLVTIALSSCGSLSRHASAERGSAPPYPYSHDIKSVTWDFSTLDSLRRAHGSDIWPCAWANDGNLYCAWGDGGGFDGDSDTTGRVSLGFARISGAPDSRDPDGFTGKNVWGDAPQYAEHAATFGGKVHTMTSVDGVLYAYGSLWTQAETPDPVHRSNSGKVPTLIWSDDLGSTWQRAPWTSRQLGSFLNFGQDNGGALDSYVYIYYSREGDDNDVFLMRAPKTQLRADPGVVGVYEYLMGVDEKGEPGSWSAVEADARPIFTDPNGVVVEVVYDAPIGRYLLTSGHNPKRTAATDSAGKVGLFESPNPWGPWSTVGYYEDWGRLGPDSFGDYLGLRFPAKWISADGATLWAVFSSLGRYDSFNVVRARLRVARSIPKLASPAIGDPLTPGQTVTARGSGRHLSWSVERLGAEPRTIATGRGRALTFTVPGDLARGEQIRISLHGRSGRVFRDYVVSGSQQPGHESP